MRPTGNGWCPGLLGALNEVEQVLPGAARPVSVSDDDLEDWEKAKRIHIDCDLAGQTVQIVYQGADGDQTSRRITIKRLYECASKGYIEAHCHERGASRTFRVDRIEEIIDLGTGEVHTSWMAWLRLNGVTVTVVGREPDPALAVQRSVETAWDKVRPGVIALMFAARHDGQVHPDEDAVVAQFIRKRLSTRPPAADIVAACERRANGLFPTGQDLLDAAFYFSTCSKKQREHLLLALEEIILADGRIKPSETAFVRAFRASVEAERVAADRAGTLKALADS